MNTKLRHLSAIITKYFTSKSSIHLLVYFEFTELFIEKMQSLWRLLYLYNHLSYTLNHILPNQTFPVMFMHFQGIFFRKLQRKQFITGILHNCHTLLRNHSLYKHFFVYFCVI